MDTASVTIKALEEDEIPLLAQHIRRPHQMHRERFALQQEGHALYLVAWQEDVPVGHVLLEWTGTTTMPIAALVEHCPNIADLFVCPEHRSRGIGSRLLAVVESLVQQHGYPQVGLGVAIDNVRARALYERCGYQDAGFAAYPLEWVGVDEQGHEQLRTEICIYLIKPL